MGDCCVFVIKKVTCLVYSHLAMGRDFCSPFIWDAYHGLLRSLIRRCALYMHGGPIQKGFSGSRSGTCMCTTCMHMGCKSRILSPHRGRLWLDIVVLCNGPFLLFNEVDKACRTGVSVRTTFYPHESSECIHSTSHDMEKLPSHEI